MVTAAVLALALTAGVHPVAVALVALAIAEPWAFLMVALAWSIYHARLRAGESRERPAAEADFLRAVAAEVDGGASVRSALAAAADRVPALALGPVVRSAMAGRPPAEVSAALEQALPLNGRFAGAAYMLVSETGARSAAVFSGLALRAATAGEVARDRRLHTTQARASAWLIGGLPAAVTVGLVATGRGPGATGGVATAVTVLGLGLVVAGVGLVVFMVRKA